MLESDLSCKKGCRFQIHPNCHPCGIKVQERNTTCVEAIQNFIEKIKQKYPHLQSVQFHSYMEKVDIHATPKAPEGENKEITVARIRNGRATPFSGFTLP